LVGTEGFVPLELLLIDDGALLGLFSRLLHLSELLHEVVRPLVLKSELLRDGHLLALGLLN
jgi:hypothetical protein